MPASAYWFEVCPPNSPSPFLVFDTTHQLHPPLCRFAKEALTLLSPATVRGYLYQVLPFFAYLDTDPWQQRAHRCWTDPPRTAAARDQ